MSHDPAYYTAGGVVREQAQQLTHGRMGVPPIQPPLTGQRRATVRSQLENLETRLKSLALAMRLHAASIEYDPSIEPEPPLAPRSDKDPLYTIAVACHGHMNTIMSHFERAATNV